MSGSQNADSRGFEQGAAFRAALARFSRRTEDICQRHGLSTDQYTLLLMVKGDPSGKQRSTVKSLSSRLQLSRNGIAERVQRAEEAGLIRRQRSNIDRRVIYLLLTERAETRLHNAFVELRGDARLVQALVEALIKFEHEQLDADSGEAYVAQNEGQPVAALLDELRSIGSAWLPLEE